MIRYLIEGKVERKVGSGRKRKTSERTEKEILRLVKKKRRISLKEVKKTLNLNVSRKTITRRLHEVSFFKILNNCVVYLYHFCFCIERFSFSCSSEETNCEGC